MFLSFLVQFTLKIQGIRLYQITDHQACIFGISTCSTHSKHQLQRS